MQDVEIEPNAISGIKSCVSAFYERFGKHVHEIGLDFFALEERCLYLALTPAEVQRLPIPKLRHYAEVFLEDQALWGQPEMLYVSHFRDKIVVGQTPLFTLPSYTLRVVDYNNREDEFRIDAATFNYGVSLARRYEREGQKALDAVFGKGTNITLVDCEMLRFTPRGNIVQLYLQ